MSEQWRKAPPRVRPVKSSAARASGTRPPVRSVSYEETEEAKVEYMLAADELIHAARTRLPDALRSAHAIGLSPDEKLVIIIGPNSPVGGPPARDGVVKMGPCSRSQFATTSFPFGELRQELVKAPPCGHWHVLACTDRAARYRCTVCHLGMDDVTTTSVS